MNKVRPFDLILIMPKINQKLILMWRCRSYSEKISFDLDQDKDRQIQMFKCPACDELSVILIQKDESLTKPVVYNSKGEQV